MNALPHRSPLAEQAEAERHADTLELTGRARKLDPAAKSHLLSWLAAGDRAHRDALRDALAATEAWLAEPYYLWLKMPGEDWKAVAGPMPQHVASAQRKYAANQVSMSGAVAEYQVWPEGQCPGQVMSS